MAPLNNPEYAFSFPETHSADWHFKVSSLQDGFGRRADSGSRGDLDSRGDINGIQLIPAGSSKNKNGI